MRNAGFTAQNGVVNKVADIVPTTKLLLIQNKGASDVYIGFANASTTIADGFKVAGGADNILPIPMEAEQGEFYSLADGGDSACTYGLFG